MVNLYRLDLVSDSGALEPVRDLLGTFLTSSYSVACNVAREESLADATKARGARQTRIVRITRISPARAQMRPVAFANNGKLHNYKRKAI